MASRKRYPCRQYAGVFFMLSSRKGAVSQEKTYYIRYRLQGKLVEEKAGHQYRDAMTALKAALMRAARMEGRELCNAARRAQRQQDVTQRQQGTIDALWWAFCQRPGATKCAADHSNYKHVQRAVGHRALHDLRTAELEDWRDALLAQGFAAQTVKHVLGLLRRIIRFAVLRGLCAAPDPVALRFVMPRVDNRKTECLTPEQARRLLQALDVEENQRLASLVRMALVTGMRRGALLRLQWSDVDWQRGFITLRAETAKKGREDVIPLTPAAQNILKAVPQCGTLIFGHEDGPVDKGLRALLNRVRKRAALPQGFRPLHGLRHTYASWLASSGQVDLYTLQKLLTHENPAMTQRYAHLADERLRTAAAVADRLYGEAVGEGRGL